MTDDYCGAQAKSTGEPCKRPAGWGVDGKSSGRCKFHGGASPGGQEGNDGGAPGGNGNALTHGVNADPFNLYSHLSDDAKEWVDALIVGYCDLLGYDEQDPRRERVKRACMHIYQANSGENQILEDGLSESQTIGINEVGAPVVRDDGHHLHTDTLKRDKEARQILRTLGAFDDPMSNHADAIRGVVDLFEDTE